MLILNKRNIYQKRVLSFSISYKLHTYPPKIERLRKSKMEVTRSEVESDIDGHQLYSQEGKLALEDTWGRESSS